jgi:hypothetical protein
MFSTLYIILSFTERVYSDEEYQGTFGENLWYRLGPQ